ncbi:hypothetical protein [Psychrilyobacter sp.]|uniref:hypothetical protein n=1 Tax=Psychrilyobacter sp. TaxID=2586924 RepID=UPI00301688D2
MKKKILLVAGILAVSSMALGAVSTATNVTGYTDAGTFNISAEIVTNLTVDVNGNLAYGDMVVPDTGINKSTIENAAGVTVTFVTADKDETVTAVLTGNGITTDGTVPAYSIDAGGVTVAFTNNNTNTWTGISTLEPFTIGGTMSVTSAATSEIVAGVNNNDIADKITITLTYDTIDVASSSSSF